MLGHTLGTAHPGVNMPCFFCFVVVVVFFFSFILSVVSLFKLVKAYLLSVAEIARGTSIKVVI